MSTKTTMEPVEKYGAQRQGQDYIHGDHAAIIRQLAVFARRMGVDSSWHESGLTVELGGTGSVDNAASADFDSDYAEAHLILTDGEETFKVNVACLLAALTAPALEAMQLADTIKRVEKKAK